jgi:hypothetical protein
MELEENDPLITIDKIKPISRSTHNNLLLLLTFIVMLLSICSYFLGSNNIELHKKITSISTSKLIPSISPTLLATESATPISLAYKIGNFVYITDDNYVYETDRYGKRLNAILSNTEKYNGRDEPCDKVNNISEFHGDRKIPHVAQDITPSIYIYTWDEDTLKYKDNNSQTLFHSWTQQFNKLRTYTNESLSEETITNTSNSTFLELDVDISRFLGCSGSYSHPITIEKVYSNFDQAYFLNVIEGNGMYSTPEKKLIIRHKNDWLIFSETRIDNYDRDYNKECLPVEFSSRDLMCVVKIWKEKYRDKEEEKQWIERTLNSIKYIK